MLRKIIITIFCFIVSSVSFSFAYPVLNTGTQNQVKDYMTSVVAILNGSNREQLDDLISSNALPDFKSNVENAILGQGINYQHSINTIEQLGDKIKVTTTFSANGPGRNVSGLSNYFLLEMNGDSRKIVDGDFADKLGSTYVFNMVGKIFLFIVPMILLIGGFRIWMLVDAINKPLKDKTMRILIIVFLGGLGAIIYFFAGRRNSIIEAKNILNNKDTLQ